MEMNLNFSRSEADGAKEAVFSLREGWEKLEKLKYAPRFAMFFFKGLSKWNQIQ